MVVRFFFTLFGTWNLGLVLFLAIRGVWEGLVMVMT